MHLSISDRGALGAWTADGATPRTGTAAFVEAIRELGRPVSVVNLSGSPAVASSGTARLGQQAQDGAYPLLAYCPSLVPGQLGDPSFLRDHGVRFAYVAGAMANAIASEELVIAMARAGMLAFFGAAGPDIARIRAAIDRLEAEIPDLPHGFNLIHSPNEPEHEAATVALYLERGVRTVSASAYLDLTLPVVRYRVAGIHQDDRGEVVVPNRILAKVSRAEVAGRFLSPPPQRFLDELVELGEITASQASLAASIPMADDITAEADSGGHTDNRPLVLLLPELLALRDELSARYGYVRPPRVGAAGGIATPASAAAAFSMGAAYVVTGSVNQACIESGSSDAVRQMLAEAGPADVTMAPAADMFEMGVSVQVLSRGTLFPVRARRLYDLYRSFESLEELGADDRGFLEKTLFRSSLNEAWASCAAFWAERDPGQVERAEADPKHKMALLFRAYLGQSSRWANQGVDDRKLDYQVWCGPSMGAFNRWTEGSPLQAWTSRTVVAVAHNILCGAAALSRVAALRAQGVELPSEVGQFPPLDAAELLVALERHEEASSTALAVPADDSSGGSAALVESSRLPGDGSGTPPEPIAIVGMDCMFPKAEDLGGYWRNLRLGVDAIEAVPESYWSLDDYHDPDPSSPDRTYARRGGFLSPYAFDPTEFGIPPAVLEATDTSQLLGLVVAKRALADAGYSPDAQWDRSRTSVVLGVTGTQELVISLGARLGHPHWWRALRQAGVDEDTARDVVARISDAYVGWQENSFPGLLGNVVAGRIANRFDLGGTNCVTDAACASSLAAIHLACMELHTGRSDMVLSGGVDTLNDIFMHMCFSKTPALSPTGDIRPFSEAADGTLLGEGIGMLVLKRLSDAERDGDRIYAVLKGFGTSSDGRAKSIYAPLPDGQARALRSAYEVSGVTPRSIGLVEAHGTGTRAGDRAEFQGLCAVYGDGMDDRQWCAVGSVKSQIGHTKAAAGAAGVLKAALALHHKVLPGTLKVDAPNPALELDQSPFYINTETRPWLAADAPRRAAVSSFGFGGSNFHVVLEEYRDVRSGPAWDGSVQIVPLSADNPAGLAADLNALRDCDLARETTRKRATFDASQACRLVLVLDTDSDVSKVLDQALARLDQSPAEAWNLPGSVYYGVGEPEGQVAFLFPGQGAQRPGMLSDLACVFPEVLDSVDAVGAMGGLIYPPPSFSEADEAGQRDALMRTEHAQPALGAVARGLCDLMGRFGVRAGLTAGHSYGELVALYAAGRIDAQDLNLLSAARGRLMAGDGEDRGTMLAVLAPLASIESMLADEALDLVLANRNAPEQGVLSGSREQIAAAELACTARGLRYRKLDVAAAFHSPLVATAEQGFREALEAVDVAPGRFPVVANATAETYPEGAAETRDLLASQIARPVRFVESIERLHDLGARTFVELGPGARLTGLCRRILEGRGHRCLAVDASAGRRSGLFDLAVVLAELAAEGRTVRFDEWEQRAVPPRSHGIAGRVPRMEVPLSGVNYRSPSATPGRAPTAPVSSLLQEPLMAQRPLQTDRSSQATRGSDPVPGASPSGGTPAAPSVASPPAQTSSVTALSSPSAGVAAPAAAIEGLQSTLHALQQLQAQTVAAHTLFLEGQAAAQQSFQRIMEAQQQLLSGGALQPSQLPSPVPASAQPPAAPVAAPSIAPAVARETTPVSSSSVGLKSTPPVTAVAEVAPTQSIVGTAQVIELLVGVVAESTGYPEDMLDLDMDLESDLGIDSIKRVEILSLLGEKLPSAPRVEPEQLGQLQTLRQVAEFVAGTLPGDSAAAVAAPSTEGDVVSGAGPSSHADASAASPSANGGASQPVDTSAVLLSVVAELTGYPSEMLDLDLDLEADLGIDSIKRVEILSLLSARMPSAPAVEPEQLGTLRTLRQVLEFLGATGSSNAAAETPAAATTAGGTALPTEAVAESTQEESASTATQPVQRYEVCVSRLPDRLEVEDGAAMSGQWWIADDDSDLARALETALTDRGLSARRIPMGEGLPASASKDIAALLLVGGLPAHENGAPTVTGRLLGDAFDTLKKSGLALRESSVPGGALLASVTSLDGGFGCVSPAAEPGCDPVFAGLAGLVKSAAHEWPELRCRSVDLSPGFEAGAAEAVRELLAHGPIEVGLTEAGRWTLELVQETAASERREAQDDGFVVVSGGARGVTAACAIELAQQSGNALLLLGRSTEPDPEPSWLLGASSEAEVKRLLLEHEFRDTRPSPRALGEACARTLAAREIRTTLAAIREQGVSVLYRSVDVRDRSAVASAVDEARSQFGPVRGLVHGAGVLRDRRIEDKTTEQFAAVVGTKLDGFDSLVRAAGPDELQFIALFTSVSGRFGRRGQSDYAAANQALVGLAAREATRREACRVVALDWGPWAGGMVTPGLRREFEREGVGLIPLAEGARLFVAELLALGPGPTEVVLGVGLPTAAGAAVGGAAPVLVQRHELRPSSQVFLDHHRLHGNAVLPAAMMLEWFVQAATAALPEAHLVAIEGFRVLSGLTIEPSQESAGIEVRVGSIEKSGGRWVLPVSLHGDGERVHAAATVLLAAELPQLPEARDVVSGGDYPLSPADAYEGRLFHGPSLHAVAEVSSITETSITTSLRPAPAPTDWLDGDAPDAWSTDPSLVDGCFQSVILWCWENMSAPSLPSAIDRILLAPAPWPSGDFEARISVRETVGAIVISDVDIVSAGSLVARLEGYRSTVSAALIPVFEAAATAWRTALDAGASEGSSTRSSSARV